jgi:hypothetical protein
MGALVKAVQQVQTQYLERGSYEQYREGCSMAFLKSSFTTSLTI